MLWEAAKISTIWTYFDKSELVQVCVCATMSLC